MSSSGSLRSRRVSRPSARRGRAPSSSSSAAAAAPGRFPASESPFTDADVAQGGCRVAAALLQEVRNYLYTLLGRTSIHRLEDYLNRIWVVARLELLKYLTSSTSDALRFFSADDLSNLDVAPHILHTGPRQAPLDSFGWVAPNEIQSLSKGNEEIAVLHREMADHFAVDRLVDVTFLRQGLESKLSSQIERYAFIIEELRQEGVAKQQQIAQIVFRVNAFLRDVYKPVIHDITVAAAAAAEVAAAAASVAVQESMHGHIVGQESSGGTLGRLNERIERLAEQAYDRHGDAISQPAKSVFDMCRFAEAAKPVFDNAMQTLSGRFNSSDVYWTPHPVQPAARMVEQMILRPDNKKAETLLLSCSPDDLDVERHMGAVKGTFVCRNIDYLHAVLDAVVTAVGEDGVLDARLGFQQDGAPRWRESVVLAGGGDDHGMDVVVRLTVDVPNNVPQPKTVPFVCSLHLALRAAVTARKRSGADKILNMYRSASELLLRLGHLNIDPGSDNIVNESNRQGSSSSRSSAKTSFQAAARRRSAIAEWRKRRRSPSCGEEVHNTRKEHADEAHHLVSTAHSDEESIDTADVDEAWANAMVPQLMGFPRSVCFAVEEWAEEVDIDGFDFPPPTVLSINVASDQSVFDISPELRRLSKPGRLNEKQDRNAMVSAILPHLRQVNGHPRAVALFKKVVLATYQFSSQDFDRQIVTRFLTYEGHENYVSAVAVSSSGDQLLTGSWDSTLCLWDTGTGRLMKRFVGHTRFVTGVCFFPPKIDPRDSNKTASRDPWKKRYEEYTTVNDVQEVRFCSCSWDKTVRIWDAGVERQARLTLQGHEGYVVDVACSGNGRKLVTASYDKTARVWDARIGACLCVLEGHTGMVVCCDWIHGRNDLVVTGSADGFMAVWDVRTGSMQQQILAHPQHSVSDMAMYRDLYTEALSLVSVGADNKVRLWDIHEMTFSLELMVEFPTCVAVSDDQQWVAIGTGKSEIYLWNCAEGRWFPGTVALEGGPGICDITFFPSSYIFVVTSLDNIARVWTVLQRFVDEVESERKQMKDALRQTAATRIQTKVRRRHQQRSSAAGAIQSLWRGFQARCLFRNFARKHKSGAGKTPSSPNVSGADISATRQARASNRRRSSGDAMTKKDGPDRVRRKIVNNSTQATNNGSGTSNPTVEKVSLRRSSTQRSTIENEKIPLSQALVGMNQEQEADGQAFGDSSGNERTNDATTARNEPTSRQGERKNSENRAGENGSRSPEAQVGQLRDRGETPVGITAHSGRDCNGGSAPSPHHIVSELRDSDAIAPGRNGSEGHGPTAHADSASKSEDRCDNDEGSSDDESGTPRKSDTTIDGDTDPAHSGGVGGSLRPLATTGMRGKENGIGASNDVAKLQDDDGTSSGGDSDGVHRNSAMGTGTNDSGDARGIHNNDDEFEEDEGSQSGPELLSEGQEVAHHQNEPDDAAGIIAFGQGRGHDLHTGQPATGFPVGSSDNGQPRHFVGSAVGFAQDGSDEGSFEQDDNNEENADSQVRPTGRFHGHAAHIDVSAGKVGEFNSGNTRGGNKSSEIGLPTKPSQHQQTQDSSGSMDAHVRDGSDEDSFEEDEQDEDTQGSDVIQTQGQPVGDADEDFEEDGDDDGSESEETGFTRQQTNTSRSSAPLSDGEFEDDEESASLEAGAEVARQPLDNGADDEDFEDDDDSEEVDDDDGNGDLDRAQGAAEGDDAFDEDDSEEHE